MPLKTKNVFLTGGAQGLGKSYTDALLTAGARVYFGDINAKAGQETEREFQEKYGQDSVKFQALDCTNFTQFEEVFQAAVSFLGHVDLMVNNAGMLNETNFEATIQLNFTSVVKGTIMAAAHMRKDKGGKGGRIINISSLAGLQDVAIMPVYCGTKHAIRAFTSSLVIAPDIEQQGIEYGVLCPGATATDMILKVDEHKIRHIDTVPPQHLKAITAPIARIQEAFMKLATLDQMNGAILFATYSEITFSRMDRVSLGDDWPVKQEQANAS